MGLKDANAFKKLGGLSSNENDFVNSSVAWRDQQERQQKKRRRNTILSLSIFSAIALALGSWGWFSSVEATKNLELANANEQEAEENAQEARKNAQEARRNAQEAEEQKKVAEQSAAEAKEQALIAEFQTEQAVSYIKQIESFFKEHNIPREGLTLEDGLLEQIYGWILTEDHVESYKKNDPLMSELTQLIKRDCPNAITLGECKEWSSKLYGDILKTADEIE
ncbi:MAG: hypothetical protein AAGF26_03310 [Cyanobacteria bacterium P01_G01_bin.49]